MQLLNSTTVAGIIVGVAIVIAASLIPSEPQFVSGGERSAYVIHPDTGDLYYCMMHNCMSLTFKD